MNISEEDRSGFLIQFIATTLFCKLTLLKPHKCSYFKHDFSVHVWICYSIPRKMMFLEFNPHPLFTPSGGGLVNMTFLSRSGYFIQFLAKEKFIH